MRSHRVGELLLAETAASVGTAAGRAQALLAVLRPLVPFDGACLALTDPVADNYQSLASVDLDEPTVDFLCGPLIAQETGVAATDASCPPFSPSTARSVRAGRRLNLSGPVDEVPTWAECVMPAGNRDALTVALFAPSGRHVGLLALLSGRLQQTMAARRRLGRLAPVLAHGIDPMRSMAIAARLVRDATAGVVLHTDGGCEPLPGLSGDVLLDSRSALLVIARHRIDDGQVFSSFLWPRGGRHAPGGHVRVTVLRAPGDVPSGMAAVALLSPAADLRGLTPRELDVLGLLVDGCSNKDIARILMVATPTVATHLEHVLAKLGVPSRTLAAVHAERNGLYVPATSQ